MSDNMKDYAESLCLYGNHKLFIQKKPCRNVVYDEGKEISENGTVKG